MDQLSNFELLDIFTTYTSDGAGHFMNFLTVFSAYLVAGYLAAGRLGRMTMISLSVLYVLVVSMIATGSYLALSGAIDFAHEITMRNITDANHMVAVAMTMAGVAGETMLLLNPIVELLACIGSIAFIFRHRSEQNRNRDCLHNAQ